jgi:hypothetical protein
MESKIQLVNEDNVYYLLVFDEYSDNFYPHLKIGFPYSCLGQQETLQKARIFGRTLSKNLSAEF